MSRSSRVYGQSTRGGMERKWAALTGGRFSAEPNKRTKNVRDPERRSRAFGLPPPQLIWGVQNRAGMIRLHHVNIANRNDETEREASIA